MFCIFTVLKAVDSNTRELLQLSVRITADFDYVVTVFLEIVLLSNVF